MLRRGRVPLVILLMLIALLALASRTPFTAQAANHAPRPAQQGSPTPQPTPRLEPTLRAGLSGDFGGTPIYGPEDGSLEHDPTDTQIALLRTGVSLADFVVEVTFVNPFSPDDTNWSHGLLFRDDIDQYRLIIDGSQTWALSLLRDDEFIDIATGTLAAIETEKGAENRLRLVVNGGEGIFSINGETAPLLDLSDVQAVGDIAVGTGMYTETEQASAFTDYRDFTIWAIGAPPIPTPTLMPVRADAASVGANRGEIEVGGGQIWTFEARAGQPYTIRVLADRPAGVETNTRERVERNLLDAYLIVRGPEGEIVAENDDDETVSETALERTNSRVQFTTDSDGTYTIEVRSYDDASGGAYTLDISSRRQLQPVTPTPTVSANA
jgi:hypothetical protein